MDIIGILLSLLGIILAVIASAINFFTVFSPHLLAEAALSNAKNWEKIPHSNEHKNLYSHTILKSITIEVDYSRRIIENFEEMWMKCLYRPDKTSNSYRVYIYFNGIPLIHEDFLSYDGGRNFIPIPTYELRGKKCYLEFSPLQIRLYRIIGSSYLGDNIPDKILKSVYNPIPDTYNDAFIKERMENLSTSLKALRSNSTILNN